MYVMNASRMMKSINLGKDEQGKYKSLFLRPREVSRLLTDEEAASPEVSKLLQLRELVPVTADVAKRLGPKPDPFVIVDSPK